MRSHTSTPGAIRSSGDALGPVSNWTEKAPSRSPQPMRSKVASADTTSSLANGHRERPSSSADERRHSRSRAADAASSRCEKSQMRCTGDAAPSTKRRSAASRSGSRRAEIRSSRRARRGSTTSRSPRSIRLTVGWVTPSNSPTCACFIPRARRAAASTTPSGRGVGSEATGTPLSTAASRDGSTGKMVVRASA